MDVCRICNTPLRGGVLRKTGRYHRECLRMQEKGMLRAGYDRKPKDSTGRPCTVCHQVIDGPHAHRGGLPLHRECL